MQWVDAFLTMLKQSLLNQTRFVQNARTVMIGIVLWSDATAGKAIIWCEDQGDLAFYTHVGTFDNFAIRSGDWVSFELTLENDLRVALDIQVLQEPGCPGLADDLAVASKKACAGSSLKLVAQEGASCDIPVTATAATCVAVAEKPGSPVRLGRPSTAGVRREEAEQSHSRVVPLADDDEAQNIIAFPLDAAGRLRRA
ncbi:hypothetical protein [Pseudophaeobacter arcticus]